MDLTFPETQQDRFHLGHMVIPHMLNLDTKLLSLENTYSPVTILKALSPQDFSATRAACQICYGIHDTPCGQALIATMPEGICNLDFLTQNSSETAVQHLGRQWPNVTLFRDQATTQALRDQIFVPRSDRSSTPLTLLVRGTPFQIQVWQTLLKVPYGATTTYQAIAEAIGRSTAVRAVGNAVGQNAIGYLIPCHRVIRASGELGGYRWGIERKRQILDWEAQRIQSNFYEEKPE